MRAIRRNVDTTLSSRFNHSLSFSRVNLVEKHRKRLLDLYQRGKPYEDFNEERDFYMIPIIEDFQQKYEDVIKPFYTQLKERYNVSSHYGLFSRYFNEQMERGYPHSQGFYLDSNNERLGYFCSRDSLEYLETSKGLEEYRAVESLMIGSSLNKTMFLERAVLPLLLIQIDYTSEDRIIPLLSKRFEEEPKKYYKINLRANGNYLSASYDTFKYDATKSILHCDETSLTMIAVPRIINNTLYLATIIDEGIPLNLKKIRKTLNVEGFKRFIGNFSENYKELSDKSDEEILEAIPDIYWGTVIKFLKN